jgi:AraC-like DNA-binding protein
MMLMSARVAPDFSAVIVVSRGTEGNCSAPCKRRQLTDAAGHASFAQRLRPRTDFLTSPATSAALPRQTMRVAAGSARDFELWRWAVAPMFEIDAAKSQDRSSYRVQSDGYYYDEMPISATHAAATSYDRPSRVIAKAGLDNVLLSIYEDRDYLICADGQERTIRAGDIVALDLSRPSRITAPEAASITVIVPRHLLSNLSANLDDSHGLVLPKGSPLNALLASHMRELLIQAPRLDRVAGLAVTRATAALAAACLGTAEEGRVPASSSIRTAVLRLIRQAIDENLGNPELGPDFLARRFALSRARLYRMFEPLGGVKSYIQQRRLMRAHQAISDPAFFHESITTLAERYGFMDKSAFSRAYRALYGVSPSESRARVRTGFREASQLHDGVAGSFLEVNRWINGIETG